MRQIHKARSACPGGAVRKSLCIIHNVYVDDSGDYWCETGNGKKSNNISITVTGGSVILESPYLPVMEGHPVTLGCKHKSSTNISALFYKNDIRIKEVQTGNLTIHSVSKSDQGFYKCSIDGAGESAQSLLEVRDDPPQIPLCSDQVPVLLYLLLRTVGTIVWVGLLLLMLRKHDRKTQVLQK
ncbi:high affinity immunoglobulin gamma Fc receptor IB-like [Sphaeramia orbicularis]|uniref:high affinity immunoglobulin gamma Fc receptor IB-like n=1 Tax=Sphaeramia orbicularis TaxID=375764 RepID=UPI00117FDBB8|nr:high affinity immunoglobulin gamma Fc receptor IB-like [Sphaeramia orbicularis]